MTAAADSHTAPLLVVQPLLVRAPMAALMCGCSERHWRRLCATGRCPQPLDLAGIAAWSVSGLIEWINAGCPSRNNNGNAASAARLVRRETKGAPNDNKATRM